MPVLRISRSSVETPVLRVGVSVATPVLRISRGVVCASRASRSSSPSERPKSKSLNPRNSLSGRDPLVLLLPPVLWLSSGSSPSLLGLPLSRCAAGPRQSEWVWCQAGWLWL